jgi:hypothetical protein
VDQSRAILPRPACGESPGRPSARAGVPGLGEGSLGDRSIHKWGRKLPSPASRAARGSRPLPASGAR